MSRDLFDNNHDADDEAAHERRVDFLSRMTAKLKAKEALSAPDFR
jgi:hypothetical protein